MKKIRFEREHDVAISNFETKTYPAGWVGEVEDDVAKSAFKAKAAVEIIDDADAELDDEFDERKPKGKGGKPKK